MTLPANTSRLINLMQEHGLKAKGVALLLGRAPKTVRMWRSAHGPCIPDSLLELLELKLKNRPVQSSLPFEQEAEE